MVTLSAHATVGGVLSAPEARAGIVAAVMLLSAGVHICYGRAPAITARVRPETAHGILRVIAFVLLLCIGVRITWTEYSHRRTLNRTNRSSLGSHEKGSVDDDSTGSPRSSGEGQSEHRRKF